MPHRKMNPKPEKMAKAKRVVMSSEVLLVKVEAAALIESVGVLPNLLVT